MNLSTTKAMLSALMMVFVSIILASCEQPLSAGDEFQDCPECPLMVVISAGEFMMGSLEDERSRSDNEGPQHRVTISKQFSVGKFEVTFAQWDACVSAGGCNGYRPDDEGWGRNNHPVMNVSRDDAKSYVAWLNSITSNNYRLLSEAEWEYSARAGTTTLFSFGTRINSDQANFVGNITFNGSSMGIDREKTIVVGGFPANAFGLHDMHGNVWEWVEDCWHDSYTGAPSDGSAWLDEDSCASISRGGSWSSWPYVVRSAVRDFWGSVRNKGIGFRLARELD